MNNQKNAHKEDTPLVSIIVITYNSSKFVLETLESAKAQTYENIELIVSDDASTDDTVEICRRWLDKNKERFVRTELITVPENTGIPANCNRGLQAAKGEWIKYIAGDDALMEGCVESYMEYIKVFPDVKFIHARVNEYQNTFDDNNLIKITNESQYLINQPHLSAKEQFNILLRVNRVKAASVMMSRNLFYNYGFFDESIKLFEDRPMWLKLTQNNIRLHFFNIVAAKYRKHDHSVHNKKDLVGHINRKKQKEKYVLRVGKNSFSVFELLCNNLTIYYYSIFLSVGKLACQQKNLASTKAFKHAFGATERVVRFINRQFVKNYD